MIITGSVAVARGRIYRHLCFLRGRPGGSRRRTRPAIRSARSMKASLPQGLPVRLLSRSTTISSGSLSSSSSQSMPASGTLPSYASFAALQTLANLPSGNGMPARQILGCAAASWPPLYSGSLGPVICTTWKRPLNLRMSCAMGRRPGFHSYESSDSCGIQATSFSLDTNASDH